MEKINDTSIIFEAIFVDNRFSPALLGLNVGRALQKPLGDCNY